MIDTCFKLFDLTSASKDWGVAADWLEEQGHPLAHVFRSGMYCLFNPESYCVSCGGDVNDGYDFDAGNGFGSGNGAGTSYGSGPGDGAGTGVGSGSGSGSGHGTGSGFGAGLGMAYGDGRGSDTL